MTIADMKVEMIGLLTKTQSEDKIAQLYEKMQQVMEAPEVDWWDDLTAEQQKQLVLSVEQSKQPDNWVEYSHIQQKYKRWFKK
jgi:hypothetical protein